MLTLLKNKDSIIGLNQFKFSLVKSKTTVFNKNI